MLYSVAVWVWLWLPTLTPPNASVERLPFRSRRLIRLVASRIRDHKALSAGGNCQATRADQLYCCRRQAGVDRRESGASDNRDGIGSAVENIELFSGIKSETDRIGYR